MLTIRENLMNVVPLHKGASYQYDYNAPCRHVVVPAGEMLPLVVTVDGATGAGRTVQVSDTDWTSARTFSGFIQSNGDFEVTYFNAQAMSVTTVKGRCVLMGKELRWVCTYIKGGVEYEMTVKRTGSGVNDTIYATEAEMTDGCNLYDRALSGTGITFGGMSMKYQGTQELSIDVVDACSGVRVTEGVSVTARTTGVMGLGQSAGVASMSVARTTLVEGAGGGVYYLRVGVVTGGQVESWYVSEPFEWVTGYADMLRLRYRRSIPVVGNGNCLVFEHGTGDLWLEMWLKADLLMPPYVFNEEVEEMDGKMFVRKQVSYREERVETLMTEYQLEAVRLLWHCDERLLRKGRLYGAKVDYMAAPEVDWGVDRRLADVTLTMQTDTVVQTNGTVGESTWSDSNAPEDAGATGSFDASFDGSYGD